MLPVVKIRLERTVRIGKSDGRQLKNPGGERSGPAVMAGFSSRTAFRTSTGLGGGVSGGKAPGRERGGGPGLGMRAAQFGGRRGKRLVGLENDFACWARRDYRVFS